MDNCSTTPCLPLHSIIMFFSICSLRL
jgi:hypothetical protein